MDNIASYVLSAYSFIYEKPIDELFNVRYQSLLGNPIPSFEENTLIELCIEVEQIFMKENNLLEINGDIIIVGDIHGSLHDLLRILKFIQDQNSKVLFLGDYVDRGNFSLECITILYALKISQPDRFFLIRGNHEFDSICSIYGFKNEILNYHKKQTTPYTNETNQNKKSSLSPIGKIQFDEDEYCTGRFSQNSNCYKYSEKLYQSFIHSFSYLPISAKLNSTTFCMHGGLSPNLEHTDQINTLIKRPIDSIESNDLISDLVWSDPSHSTHRIFEDNPRGCGYLFNRDSVINFLKRNSLTRIIRAHQCIKKGVEKMFNDKCITVFSASSYDKVVQNYSSILQLFENDDTIKVHTFKPLQRLEKCDCIYYKVQSRFSNEEKSRFCFSLMHPRLVSSVNDRSAIIKTSSRSIRSQKSENSIYSYHPYHSKSMNFVIPKFVTNKKKYFNSIHIQHSFSSLDSSQSEYTDNSGMDMADT